MLTSYTVEHVLQLCQQQAMFIHSEDQSQCISWLWRITIIGTINIMSWTQCKLLGNFWCFLMFALWIKITSLKSSHKFAQSMTLHVLSYYFVWNLHFNQLEIIFVIHTMKSMFIISKKERIFWKVKTHI